MQEDIEGFVADGAPVDEYEDEAHIISDSLSLLSLPELNETNISKIISQVWVESFDLNGADLERRQLKIDKVSRLIVRDVK